MLNNCKHINQQLLLNAEVEIARARFLIDCRGRPETHKHFNDGAMDDEKVKQHIKIAIRDLTKMLEQF